ncbi:phosphatidate cytidylyltransferase family protein [Cryptosporidium serpentis]
MSVYRIIDTILYITLTLTHIIKCWYNDSINITTILILAVILIFSIYLVYQELRLRFLIFKDFQLVANLTFPLFLSTICSGITFRYAQIIQSYILIVIMLSILIYLDYKKKNYEVYFNQYWKLSFFSIMCFITSSTKIQSLQLLLILLFSVKYYILLLKFLSLKSRKSRSNGRQFCNFGELNLASQFIGFILMVSLIIFKESLSTTNIPICSLCFACTSIFSTLVLPFYLYFYLQITSDNGKQDNRTILNISYIFRLFIFIIGLVITIIGFLPYISTNIFLYIINNILYSAITRLLILYWLTILVLLLVSLNLITGIYSGKNKIMRVTIRKFFHFVTITILLPPLLLCNNFQENYNIRSILSFIFTSTFAVINIFVYIEIIRKSNICNRFTNLTNFLLLPFIDEKDSMNGFILTHTYLLFGLYFPIMNEYLHFLIMHKFDLVAACIGLATTGIGDAFSAMLGVLYGNKKLPGNEKKTYIGSLSFFVSCLLFLLFISNISYLHFSTPIKLVLLAWNCSLLEAYTKHIDNAIVPIYALTLYLNLNL